MGSTKLRHEILLVAFRVISWIDFNSWRRSTSGLSGVIKLRADHRGKES